MKRTLFTTTFFIISILSVYSQAPQDEPALIINNRNVLYRVKKSIQRNDADVIPAFNKLISDADKLINEKYYSVMMKKQMPPSGDKHDYVSRAPYWWRDKTKKDGLPYIRKDGETNPEYYDFTDHEYLSKVSSMVYKLGLAYYFTGNEKYAAHAAKQLRTWFLDDETKMNPNLNYAQQIPGVCDGRGVGLIDTRNLTWMLDGVILISTSSSWTDNDDKGLKDWFAKFAEWMQTSKNGLDESKAKNNHGTYYDAQIAAYLIYNGKRDEAGHYLADVTRRRMDNQFAADGEQPEEMARTKPWGYCTMNLAGFVELALIAEKVGINLWDYETPKGVTLRNVIEWFFPYLSKEKTFPKEEITGIRGTESLAKVLMIAGIRFGRDEYGKQLNNLPAFANDKYDFNTSLLKLTFPLYEEGPLTDDEEFFEMLNLDYPGLGTVKQDVERKDYTAAKHDYVKYLKSRTKPKWYFDWRDYNSPQSRNGNFNLTDADKYASNNLQSCGIWHQFGDEINWSINPTPLKYCEWTWQLSRHWFWVELGKAYWATGNEKYARAFVKQMRSWVAQNQLPDYSAGGEYSRWRTIETGIRASDSWPKSFFYFLGSPSFDDESIVMMVKSFYEHGLHLRTHHRQNNWLTMEMNGLFHIGILFPEFKTSSEWCKYSSNRLHAEKKIQFYPDGAQLELTTGYHGVSLNNMLDIYKIASINDYPLPDDYITGFENVYNYYLNIMMPDGCMPALNDAGWGDCRKPLEQGFSLLPKRTDFLYAATKGAQGTKPTFTSKWMPWAGWYMMRSDWDSTALYAHFDVGPYGAAHQHEDKLQPLMSAYGKRLITEGGTYAYDTSQWRKYVLSARAHNITRIDGKDQNRRIRDEEDLIIHSRSPLQNRWITNEHFDFGEGWYNEGRGDDLDSTVMQYRALVFIKNKYWILFDIFTPKDNENHEYMSWFHFNSTKYDVDKTLNSVKTTDAGEPNIAIVRLRRDNNDVQVIMGQEHPEVQGWVPAEGYDCKPIATPTFIRTASGQCVEPYIFYPLRPNEELPIAEVKALGESSFEIIYKNGEKETITFGIEGDSLKTLNYSTFTKKGKRKTTMDILK